MSPPLTAEEAHAIRAREQAATPGPWVTDIRGCIWASGLIVASGVSGSDGPTTRFIAAAREDVPRLLDALDERDAEIARLSARIAELEDDARYPDSRPNPCEGDP